MVATALGRYTSIREIRGQIDTGRDGASMRQLAEFARSNGFDARAYRVQSAEDLTQVPLPAISPWKRSHFVVVERLDRDSVSIVDPALGRSSVTPEEFWEDFGRAALVLTPNESFVRVPRPPLNFLRFVRPYIPRSPFRIGAIAVLALLLFGLVLVPPAIMQYIFDSVIPGDEPSALGPILFGVALLGVAYLASFLVRSELLLWLETRLDASLMGDFLQHLLALPYKYFQVRQLGDILVRVSSTAYVRDVLSSRLLSLMIDSLFVIGYVFVISLQSTALALVVLVIAAIQIAVVLSATRRAQALTERELAEMSNAQSVLLETVSGIEMVKSTGLEDEALRRWSVDFTKQLQASVGRRRLDNLVSGLLAGVGYLTPVLFLIVASVFVLTREITVGQAVSLNVLAGAALAPIAALGAALQSLLTARVHLERLRDILDEPSEEVGADLPPAEISGAVQVSGVSFAYGSNTSNVLEDVSFDVRPGEFIAIIGPSGSGKSTLARVLVGLLRPTEGTVGFDGTGLGSMNLRSVRKQLGIVTQASDAVSGTLRSNIRFGRLWITDEAVVHAATMAGLAGDISRMPLGLETPLGEAGLGLSGGQLQRLAIARAVAASPRILLMDEATSHLDARTEYEVCRNLATLECTRVVIAHRLSTIVDADRILYLQNGRVELMGRHDELLSEPGYADFFARQSSALA
ncbi:hypothetical protein ATC03_01485 [Agromyces aureus]|uniref:Uncharacterized protein n=2 Tax=Agromyces aureus TaxID=453304 RepID=A0A191WBJ5_9MICO|nr:hypothetical protein ATC03_01485 [Agromyces aureus]